MTRYLPKLVAEIFGGRYYVTFHGDGTCTVTTYAGPKLGWVSLRRR